MNYIQPQIIKYKLSVIEGMILDYIMRAFSWADKKEMNGKEFVKLHSQKILDDLPVMGITTKNGLSKHINKLINMGLIEKKLSSNSPYFAITDYTKNYELTGGQRLEQQGVPFGTSGCSIWNYNSSISNSSIKYITIPIDQVKKKSKKLAEKLQELISSLNGKTDLIDVGADDIIKLWNSYNVEYKLPKVNVNNPDSVMIKSIRRVWADFKNKYTKEEFNVGLQNYLKNIKFRKQDGKIDGYYNHRFTLYIFLTQKNGIEKFMSEG